MNSILALSKKSALPGDYRKLAYFGTVVLSALIASQLILKLSPIQLVFLAAGVISLVISVRKPEIGVLMIIVIISSIIKEESLPVVRVPGGSFHATDIILLFLLFMIPFKMMTDRNFHYRRTPLDVPLFLFGLAFFISIGISFFVRNVDFHLITLSVRLFMNYFLYFVLTNLIREKKQIRLLLYGMLAVSLVISLAIILQAILGKSHAFLPTMGAGTYREIPGALRIGAPGHPVLFVMFIMTICALSQLNVPVLKSRYYYLLFIFGIALLLTFTRNYWVSIAISVILLALLVSKQQKKKMIVLFLGTAIVFGLIFPFLIDILPRSYVNALSMRFGSLLTPSRTLSSGSLEGRRIENYYAWKSIRKNPVFGIGLYQVYRPRLSWMDIFKPGEEWPSTSYIHNGYLWILLDLGLFGFIPFIWFYVRFLMRGFSNWRKIKDPLEKSAVLGFTLGGCALAMSALVTPKFFEWAPIVVIGVIMGLSETIITRNEEQDKTGRSLVLKKAITMSKEV